ncbi:two-component sensor histidine kinase [Heyndrickxia sporothermodurans]|nr:two-component sensor histidine kinase [Heyndrickxia sporothermodurans]
MKNDLFTDISFALQHNYSDYLSFKLNKYYNSNSFVPNNLDTFLQMIFSQDKDMNAVALRSNTTNIEYLFIFNHNRWNRSIISTETQISEIPIKQNNPKDSDRFRDTFIFKENINDPALLKNLGHIAVYYSFDGIDELIDARKNKLLGSIFIFNHEGENLYSSSKGDMPESLRHLSFSTYSKKISWKGNSYYLNTLADEATGYMFVGLIPEKEISKITIVHWTMVLFTFLFATGAIIIAYFAMRNYAKRIYAIDYTMKQVKKGNLAVRVQNDSKKDELSTISFSLNNMLDELNQYIEQVYILNIQQREAEMKALQSQIQPHFLYNTLEAIRMKAVIDGSKTTSVMIYNLGELFRYSLTPKEMVTIGDEIEHIKKYLELMQIRYSSNLQVFYEIPERYYSNEILKFTFQPLIENYAKHGYRKEAADNCVWIEGEEVNDRLHLYIKDNGFGISNMRLEQIREQLNEKNVKSGSIGLSNVNERMKLKYGKEYGIHINSELGKGTVVEIIIPIS